VTGCLFRVFPGSSLGTRVESKLRLQLVELERLTSFRPGGTLHCSPPIHRWDDFMGERMHLHETITRDIIERLQPIHPEKVILFGSYAYGEPHKDSDIDLLVVTGDEFIPQNFAEKMQVTLRVVNMLDALRTQVAMDIIVHTKPMHKKFIALNSMFSREVLKKGIVLYENSHPGMAQRRP